MADKKPLTDEQQDLLMDYLLDKFMREKESEQMRKEDRYNQPPQTDSVGKAIVSANMGGMISMDQMTAPIGMKKGGPLNKTEIAKLNKAGNVNVRSTFENMADAQQGKLADTRISGSYKNILAGKEVERPFGYDGEFKIKGMDKKNIRLLSTIQLQDAKGNFVKAPDILDFDNRTKWEKAFKNYRTKIIEPAIKRDPKGTMKILGGSGYMAFFGEDTNKILLNSGKEGVDISKEFKTGAKIDKSLIDKANANKGYKFSPDYKGKIPKGAETENKLVTKIINAAKQNIKNPAMMNNVKIAISDIFNKLPPGTKRTAFLGTLLSGIAKGAFGKVLPGIDLLIPSKVEASTMYPEGVDPVKEIEMQEAQKRMNMNQGGIMDINKMTRPIMGYQEGTRNGTLVGDKEELEVREIIREANPEGIVENVKSFLTKDRNLGTIENPLPLDRLNAPGVRQEELIESGAYITTPDGITFKATPFMFDKYLGTKYVENNTFGSRDDVEVEFIPKYIEPGEQRFIDETYTPTMNPRKNGTFTEMNQGGMMDIDYLTRKLR